MLPNGERKERNSKLENFLRRKLASRVYGDVRWYEPVVVRRAETLSYKQAVITGEEIILVDTPPKEIQTLLRISNITAVLMVHDLPEFLEGGLRDRTTHVLLKVKQDSSAKNGHDKNRRGSLSKGVTSQRRGSLQHVISEEENQDSPVASPKDTEVPEISTKKAKWKRFLERQSSRDILSFSSLDLGKVPHLSKQELLTKSLAVNNTSKSGHRPPLMRGVTVTDESNIKIKRLAPAESVPSLSFGENHAEVGGEGGGGGGGLSPSYGVKEFGTRPISPALFDVLNRVEPKSLTPNGRSLTPDFSRGQSIPRSISALETYDNSTGVPSIRSRSVLDKPLNLQRRRHSSSNINSTEEVEEEEEVHLYTLSTSTHLFHLLHSLWMAFLLTPYNDAPIFNVSMQLNEEGIDLTFRSLCNDLQEANSVEEHYSLLQDLFQGLKKYSAVRRVFWRDSEALYLILELLKTYLKSSNRSREKKTEDTTRFGHRENELKIIILILQIVQVSLDHSQGCPHKGKTLNNKGLLEELLKEVFMIPEVPPPHNLMCKRFLCDYRELAEGAWQLLPEKELLILVQKSIDASVNASFQVIEAIFEIGWTGGQMGKSKARKKDSNTLSVLLQFVPIDEWLTYTMPKLLLLVQSKGKDYEESPHEEDLILIYKYLAVLMALLKQSPKALAFCISNYAEELRYYVNESVLKRRLDTLNPLTPHTFRLAKSITKLILR